MQQVVGWISITAVLLYAIAWAWHPTHRRFPSRIVFIMIVSTFPLSLAFILATFVGGDVGKVWCGHQDSYDTIHLGSPDDRAIHSGGLCTFQGVLIQFGTLSMTFWWAILSSHTLYQMLQGPSWTLTRKDNYSLEALYYAIGFGIPTITVIVGAASGQFAYEVSATYCWLTSSHDQAWRIGLWFVPIGIGLVIGTVSTMGCVVKLIVIFRAREKAAAPIILKMMVSFVLFVIADATIFSSAIYNSSHILNDAVGIVLYIVCLLRDDGGCRQQLLKSTCITTQYRLSMASTFFMASMGFLLVMCFGLTSIANVIWHRKLPVLSSSSPNSSPGSFSSHIPNSTNLSRDDL